MYLSAECHGKSLKNLFVRSIIVGWKICLYRRSLVQTIDSLSLSTVYSHVLISSFLEFLVLMEGQDCMQQVRCVNAVGFKSIPCYAVCASHYACKTVFRVC